MFNAAFTWLCALAMTHLVVSMESPDRDAVSLDDCVPQY